METNIFGHVIHKTRCLFEGGVKNQSARMYRPSDRSSDKSSTSRPRVFVCGTEGAARREGGPNETVQRGRRALFLVVNTRCASMSAAVRELARRAYDPTSQHWRGVITIRQHAQGMRGLDHMDGEAGSHGFEYFAGARCAEEKEDCRSVSRGTEIFAVEALS